MGERIYDLEERLLDYAAEVIRIFVASIRTAEKKIVRDGSCEYGCGVRLSRSMLDVSSTELELSS